MTVMLSKELVRNALAVSGKGLTPTLRMVPAVLAELLSDPSMPALTESDLLAVPLLQPAEAFWWRTGKLRAAMMQRGCRSKLVDTLIAQTRIDHSAALLI